MYTSVCFVYFLGPQEILRDGSDQAHVTATCVAGEEEHNKQLCRVKFGWSKGLIPRCPNLGTNKMQSLNKRYKINVITEIGRPMYSSSNSVFLQNDNNLDSTARLKSNQTMFVMLMKVFVSLLFRSSAYIQLQKSLITNTSSQASKSLNDIITQNVCTLYRTNSTPSIERADVMITLQTRTCEVLSSSLGQATGYPARFFIFLLSPFMHIPR